MFILPVCRWVLIGNKMEHSVVCACMGFKDQSVAEIKCDSGFYSIFEMPTFPSSSFSSPSVLWSLYRQPLFVSVVNKITPIFPSNAGAFHFNQEGWGQCVDSGVIFHSYSKLGSFYIH